MPAFRSLLPYLEGYEQSERRCETCSFWLRNVKDPQRGLCLKLSTQRGVDVETNASDCCEYWRGSGVG